MKKIVYKRYHNFHLAQIIYLMYLRIGRNEFIYSSMYSIHLPYSYSQAAVTTITFFKRLPIITVSEVPARPLASVRYSSFIAHVHGKCSANGKLSLCIDPERHQCPRQSRSWTQLYRRYNATPLISPSSRTIDTTRPFSTREENDDRCRDSVFTEARNNFSSPVHSNDIKST